MFISNRLFNIWQDLTLKANELSSQGQWQSAQGYYQEALNNAKHLFDLATEGTDLMGAEIAPALVVSSINLSDNLRETSAPGEAMVPLIEAMTMMRDALSSELTARTIKDEAAEHLGKVLHQVTCFYGNTPALDKIIANEVQKTQAAVMVFLSKQSAHH